VIVGEVLDGEDDAEQFCGDEKIIGDRSSIARGDAAFRSGSGNLNSAKRRRVGEGGFCGVVSSCRLGGGTVLSCSVETDMPSSLSASTSNVRRFIADSSSSFSSLTKS